ncbi:hypothetical protein JW823_09950 [bacterium]|nr:hypothetical protein [candidate division CSSED10-310 bacterium]
MHIRRFFQIVLIPAIVISAIAACGHKTHLRPPDPRRLEKVEGIKSQMTCDRIILEWVPVLFDTRGNLLEQPVSYLVLRKRGAPIKWEPEATPTQMETPSTESASNTAPGGETEQPATDTQPPDPDIRTPVPDVRIPTATADSETSVPESAAEDTRTQTEGSRADSSGKDQFLPAEFDYSLVGVVTGPKIDPALPDATKLTVSWEDTGVQAGPPYALNVTRFRIPGDFPPTPDAEAEGLLPGYNYSYTIAAIDMNGVTSIPSGPVEIPWIHIPAAPDNVSATVEPGRVQIQWTAPLVDCTGLPLEHLDGFEVYRAAGAAPEKFIKIKSIKASSVTAATDETAAPDNIFLYKVCGWIKPAISGEFCPAVSVDTTDRFPPPSPTQLSGAVQPSGVFLNWRPVTESGLAGYRIYRRPSTEAAFSLLNTENLIQTNTYIDSLPASGVTYSYRVTAVDGSAAANESEPGNIWSITIP